MYDQNGVINGIPWSTKYLGDRKFLLEVGHLSEEYNCKYPMIFGMDGQDVLDMNRKLDEMQEQAEKEREDSNESKSQRY